MSGVQGYVKQVGGKGIDFQTSSLGQERTAYKNQMKISMRSTRINQMPPRAPSAHDYVNFNSSVLSQGHHTGKFYDTSADSEFDETRSDLTLDQGDIPYQEDEDNETVHRDLGLDEKLPQQNKVLDVQLPSQPGFEDARIGQPVTPFISGRFQNPPNSLNHAQFQTHITRQEQLHKVFLRTDNQSARAVDNAARRVADEDGNSFDEESADEYMELGSHEESSNDNSSQIKTFTPERPINDVPESNTPIASQSRLSKAQVQANTRTSSDYTQEELAGIHYSQLQAEPWETVPKAPNFVYPHRLQEANVKLEDKIDFYSRMAFEQSKNGKDEEIEGEEAYIAQARFYASLSAADWDIAGDYLIGKFSEIMQKLKEAKRNKRKVMEEFETEIAAREETVRHKSQHIDKKLEAMENNGKELLGGRPV